MYLSRLLIMYVTVKTTHQPVSTAARMASKHQKGGEHQNKKQKPVKRLESLHVFSLFTSSQDFCVVRFFVPWTAVFFTAESSLLAGVRAT